jgi:hypothetical protein
MKQTKFNLAIFMASLCALLVLAASPVLAQSGRDGTSGSDDSSTTSEQESSDTADDSGTTETKNETETEVHHKADLFRKDGEHRLTLRREAKDHTKSKEQRAKTCVQIQKAVNNKLGAFNNHADKYLTRLNTLFTKVQAYQTEHNVSVANYDELVATATQKQSDATVAVEALKSLGTTIDCTSSDPASMLASVKSGATDSRDALKAYRTALKDIFVALVQASKTEDNATTEGN